MHRQLAEDHGFTAIADVDIMDADGDMEIPVTGGTYLTTDYVGSHLQNYDSMLVLSHFKEHPQGGFGGAIKNISIGIGSGARGKSNIHSGGTSLDTGSSSPDIVACQSSMEEAGSAVRDYLGAENMVYIKKIIIHAPDKSGGKRRQKVEIIFNFVDEVEIPVLAEPMIAESTHGRRKTA